MGNLTNDKLIIEGNSQRVTICQPKINNYTIHFVSVSSLFQDFVLVVIFETLNEILATIFGLLEFSKSFHKT